MSPASTVGPQNERRTAKEAFTTTQGEEEAATMQRLVQGVQEDMMVALLETVQSAAAVCTQICVQRLYSLHKEMISAVEDAEAQKMCNAGVLTQAEVVKRTKLSNIGGKLCRYTLDDDESEQEEEALTETTAGPTIEGIYSEEWKVLDLTPPPVKRPSRNSGRLKVFIDKEHWNRGVKRKLVGLLRVLSTKHTDLVVAPVLGDGEILAKGNACSIEAAKPELAAIILECFPFAGLPSDLRVDGLHEPVRLDPSDGEKYTLKALWDKYRGTFSQDAVWGYWEAEMQPVDTSGQGTAIPPISTVGDAAAAQQEDARSRTVEGSARPRTQNRAGARLLTRGLRDAICIPGGAPPAVQAATEATGELRVPLDKEFWTAELSWKLLPALQKISERFDNLKVVPIMGRGEIFAKGAQRSLDAAKPHLAEALLKHCPFADLPDVLKAFGFHREERVNPEDGRRYNHKTLREKYCSQYTDEELLAYWESRMRPPGVTPGDSV